MHRRAERRRRRAAFPDLESEGSELEAQEVHYDAESDADKEEAENEEDYDDDDDDDDDADADWEDVESDSSFDPWEENTTYDPNLVSEEDLEWLIYIRCIGFNPDAGKLSLPLFSLPYYTYVPTPRISPLTSTSRIGHTSAAPPATKIM